MQTGKQKPQAGGGIHKRENCEQGGDGGSTTSVNSQEGHVQLREKAVGLERRLSG